MIEVDSLLPLAAVLAGISAGILVITTNKRMKIGLVIIQYILVSILMSPQSELDIVVIKLVSGVTASLIMINTINQLGKGRVVHKSIGLPTTLSLRMIAVLLVSTASVGIGRSEFVAIPGIRPEALSAALLLGGMGLLQVSLFDRPLNLVFGIFCLLNGFELVYIVLESSIALMALLALVHIGLSVVIGILELDVEETDLQAGNL